jgi:hypothetical protein
MVIDACLVDTNVLLRIPKRTDLNHQAVDRALSKLAIDGHPCTTLIKTSRSFGTR